MWKEKVTNVSEHLFPGLSSYNDICINKNIEFEAEVLSNLPLQMALYFNVVYFPFWLIVTFVMLPYKFYELNVLYQFILILALTSVIIIECIRLYMGYIGNLNEKIPELAGFWLISLLLQTPLQLFLLFCQTLKPSILEHLTQFIMCIFIIIQLTCGFFALRYASKHSANIFHTMHLHTPHSETFKSKYM